MNLFLNVRLENDHEVEQFQLNDFSNQLTSKFPHLVSLSVPINVSSLGQLASIDPASWSLTIQLLGTAGTVVALKGIFDILLEWTKDRRQKIFIKIGENELELPETNTQLIDRFIDASLKLHEATIIAQKGVEIGGTDLRKMAERVTGIVPLGQYREVTNESGVRTGTRFMNKGGFLSCVEYESGWIFSQFNGENFLTDLWATTPDESVANTILLMGWVYPELTGSKNLEFLFSHFTIDHNPMKINRKVFSTILGEVTCVTRGVELGTVGHLEFTHRNDILKFIWSKSSGTVTELKWEDRDAC